MTLLTKADVLPLEETNLKDKWVVIDPEIMERTYFESFQTKENQIIRAWGGFGCNPKSLSVQGGKVFCTNIDGQSETVYRNDIIGYARLEDLKEIGVNIEEYLKS
jgi:hypothetical protein